MKFDDIEPGKQYVLTKGESRGSIYWHSEMDPLNGTVVTVSSRGVGGVTINDGAWFVDPSWLSPLKQSADKRWLDNQERRETSVPLHEGWFGRTRDGRFTDTAFKRKDGVFFYASLGGWDNAWSGDGLSGSNSDADIVALIGATESASKDSEIPPVPSQVYEINERGISGSIVNDGSGWHYSLEVEEKCDGEEDILALIGRLSIAYAGLQRVANFLTPTNPS